MPSENNISKNKRYFQKQLDNWINTVTQNLTNLTKPQAVVLAMMSLGMIAAQSCALTAISIELAISLLNTVTSTKEFVNLLTDETDLLHSQVWIHGYTQTSF